MTGLTPYLARTLVDDRLRSAERHGATSTDRRTISRRAHDGAPDRVVAAAATGDEEAWTELRDRYAVRVRAVARRHRLAPHDVEDVAQTTWLRLVENIRHVRDANAVGAWLETTARRESLAVLRRRKRERPTDDASLVDRPTEPVAERRLVAAEQRAALTSSLRQLPRHQHRVLAAVLAESEPSYAEIAASLKMPIGSIGPTRARSLARLRQDRELVSTIREDVDWRTGEPR